MQTLLKGTKKNLPVEIVVLGRSWEWLQYSPNLKKGPPGSAHVD